MIRGVLFDWRGTLVRDPEPEWWVKLASTRLQKSPVAEEVQHIVAQLASTESVPEVQVARQTADCSAEQHRWATMLWFTAAGLDPGLASCLYDLDFDPEAHLYYEDVAEALLQLKALNVSVAVVSDIHFDLRPEFRQKGLVELVDHFVLSYEHGIQKPNPRMFQLAIDGLGLDPDDALMVGDQPEDAGAVLLGIPTLLLPAEHGPNRGLDRVVSLVRRRSPFACG